MRTRRAVALLPAVLLVLSLSPPRAFAQGQTPIALSLDRQTPWITPQDRTVVVEVRAKNDGDSPLDGLTVAIGLGTAVRTRGEYEASLLSGPAVTAYARSFSQNGELASNQSRVFTAKFDLSTSSAISHTEPLIYPMKVSVLSHGLLVSNEMRSPILSFEKKPQTPLSFSWTVDMSSPPLFAPDGRLASTSIEASLAPGGELRSEVDALAAIAVKRVPVDLVVLPLLLDDLRRMAAGYTRVDGTVVKVGEGGAKNADAVLLELRRIVAAPSTELSAYPYAGVSVPALYASGLRGDVAPQLARGRSTVEQIIGRKPTANVARAVGGTLDHATIDALAAAGGTIYLGNAGAVERTPDPLGFLLPPTASISVGQGSNASIILPDDGTQAILASISDPVLAAQQALGEMMAAWNEHPGTPQRGIAVSLAGLAPPAPFWAAFANRVAGAPFLDPMHASALVSTIPPPDATSNLTAPNPPVFSRSYGDAIKRERRQIEALRSMLVGESTLPDRLAGDLLVAESSAYVGNESVGSAWTTAVDTAANHVFAATQLVGAQRFTLTSGEGTIPVLLGDPGDLVLNVRVRLTSSLLTFPNGNTQAVKLDAPHQFLTFDVVAQRTGQIPVQVQVISPSGRIVSQTTIFIRSTAFNRIALFITLGAAALLVALWARRFLRRPT